MSIPSLVQWPTPGVADARAPDPTAPSGASAHPPNVVFQSTLDDFLSHGWSNAAHPLGDGGVQQESATYAEADPAGRAHGGLAREGAEDEEWAALEPAAFPGAHVVTLPFPPQPTVTRAGAAQGEVVGANIEAALSTPLRELAWSAPATLPSNKPDDPLTRDSVALAASSEAWARTASATRLGASTLRACDAPGSTWTVGPIERGPARRTAVSTSVPSRFERAVHEELPAFVRSLSVESVPFAATPRGMRAATVEDRTRDVGGAEIDEALRRVVPQEQPSLPAALRSDYPAPPSTLGELEVIEATEPPAEEPRDVVGAEPSAQAPSTGGLPVQVGPQREDSPLQEAVARFTEEARVSSEARQADVERGVDALTLSRRIVADALLEGGERLRIEAAPEDRSVVLDVRIDNREVAELLTVVRGDLMAQLEGSQIARISVGFQSFDTGAGRDRQGRGDQPSAGRQGEESASPAPAPPRAAVTGNGRVRVVL